MNIEFKINGKVLETDRLILRSFKQTDLDDVYEYASVKGVGEMAGWHYHENIETSQMILDDFIKGDIVFAICLKESNKVIGTFAVKAYSFESELTEFYDYKGCELGFVLSKDHWGKGLMKEAVDRVIDYLFNDYDLDFILCGYYDFNNQSKRVQEKCGFKPYRKLVFDTLLDTKEPGVLNILINPNKDIKLVFSHPETLIYDDRV